jgi:twitching motility protein PilT
MATFHQRELGADFDTYANGLRAALRQAPKVILVGEMRDRESVEVALTAAETGHLVLSTLHTIDAGQSVNRILGMFEPNEQHQIRLRLADTLRFVASQRLVTKETGGRLLLTEVMGTNLRVREAVALGENENRSFYDIIEASQAFGWMTFDHAIIRAYQAGLINENVAELYATRKGVVTRGMDDLRKSRGIETDERSGLQLEELNPGKRKRGLLGW